MRRRAAWVATVVALGTTLSGGCDRRAPRAESAPPPRLTLDALDSAWTRLGACAAARDSTCAGAAFRDARKAFKRDEALLESLAPLTAAALNARGVEGDDDETPPRLTPSAFAAAEEALPWLSRTPNGKRADWPAAAAAAALARATLDSLRQQGELRVTPTVAFDAARLELARVATLGVTGYDTPATRDGVRESAVALRGVAELLARQGNDSGALGTAVRHARAAADYLDAHADFDSLDRVAYVVGSSEPALRALDAARQAAGVSRVNVPPRVWTGVTLFERGAIDPSAYAPFYAPPPSPALVALGARLFAEPALSGPGTQSCVGCHEPARAFADGRATARALHVGSRRLRNTPSLLAAAVEARLFADARAASLESQAGIVLGSRDEMGSSVEDAAARLDTSPAYRSAFVAAFRVTGDSAAAPVTPLRLRIALAAYVRSLYRADSRVDRAFRGDTAALTTEERRGANLFLGKAGCGTCHFAPLFAGATPPLFRAVDAEVIGVPAAADAHRLDDDVGRAAIDSLAQHRHAFKTPSLRNVALTAPYMHNGAFATLEQVVRFYDRGGGAGVGLRVPNQTLPAAPLHLTASERGALVAFLRALTDGGQERR